MKDAVQNLLSKVKPQQPNQGNQQQASRPEAGPEQGQQQNGGKQQSRQRTGSSRALSRATRRKARPASESQERRRTSRARAPARATSQQASKQPGSGIGSQDGDKSIKQAEQLAAMGKISEIIGKRSANGHRRIDRGGAAHQPDSCRRPTCSAARSTRRAAREINRDEVPVALQPYVEQYFEQVRKQARSGGGRVRSHDHCAPTTPKKQN